MTKQNELISYSGGCHCGAVRFIVRLDHLQTIKCNCSICRKKGYLHLIVKAENFQLLKGKEILNTYTFNTGIAKHTFCSICGIHSFYHPRSHPACIDINVNCLDQDILSEVEVKNFDGKNWENNVEQIRD
ncbi:MAG: GFA family protein [Cyanobacteria bacterium J083]|nr:MAG: GFA family protein [Cyanobacteria bacterium J083]